MDPVLASLPQEFTRIAEEVARVRERQAESEREDFFWDAGKSPLPAGQ